MKVCLNGRVLPEKNAHISIRDHGFLYGDGLYETLRVSDGRPLFLNEHLKRLSHGRRRLQLSIKWSNAQLSALIQKTIRANQLREAVVRVTITRGPGPNGLDPRPCVDPTLLITVRPFAGHDAIRARGGMVLALVQVRRNSRYATPPEVKSISCLNGVLAKMESIKMGADEALLLNEQGHVAEGSVSNIFIVKSGVLFTPVLDGSQLPGVIRERILKLARRLRIPFREKTLRTNDLKTADEIFLTNSLMDVMPVRMLVWNAGSKKHRRNFENQNPMNISKNITKCFSKC